MKQVPPVTMNEMDILNSVVHAADAVQRDIDARYPGIAGDARAWQLMMGDNRNEEYLRQNGAKQTADAWTFSDGSVLPNPI